MWGEQGDGTPKPSDLGGTFAVFGLIGLFAGGLFLALYQDATYSIDPPIFAEIYHHAVREGRGWPNHQYLHFFAWWLAYAVSADVWGSLDAATMVPAALASAGLWLFLVRRRGASPVVAGVLAGAVAGCANVLFFATTIEVHAMQWLATVVALWPLDVALRTPGAARRWSALVVAGALLLLAHPLHALWMPLVGVHVATRVRVAGERSATTIRRIAAIGVVFGMLAALRYWDIQTRMGWTPKTLDSWGAGTRWATLGGDLWTYLLRAHIAVIPIVALYLVRGRSDAGWLRLTHTFLWLVPLAAFVAYLGLFEAGGYFMGLGTLWVGLFAGDSMALLGRWLGTRSGLLAPLAFLAALLLSALLSGALGLRQANEPRRWPAAQVALDFVEQEVAADAHLVCFDGDLADALRTLSRRSVTGELGPSFARLPEELDGQLFEQFQKYVQHKLKIGAAVWYVRPNPPLSQPEPRRALLETRFAAWFVDELGASARQLPGLVIWGPVRAPAEEP